jgi:MerR family redox-sensitive transcriptional activator SoxR
MLTIGQVAAQTGLRASAIRYYESQGLLPPPPRVGGKRLYDAAIFDQLAAIELAKTAGFELAEIKALLTAAAGGRPARVWRQTVKGKRARIDREVRRLALMKHVLANVARCGCPTLAECGRAFRAARAKYLRT